uniref:Uncharacterized protein n=1 Tax=Candidatus Methanogaster sp. ANME-2c ERB4 TaxID=2759911 RepID=A0A7G9YK35_9EURY|nr:hypothetical protein AOAGBLIK_00001 [Methanosarcinales archaeon ANME-2c ERB4]
MEENSSVSPITMLHSISRSLDEDTPGFIIMVPPIVETAVSVGDAAPWTSRSIRCPTSASMALSIMSRNSVLSAPSVAITAAADDPSPEPTGISELIRTETEGTASDSMHREI